MWSTVFQIVIGLVPIWLTACSPVAPTAKEASSSAIDQAGAATASSPSPSPSPLSSPAPVALACSLTLSKPTLIINGFKTDSADLTLTVAGAPSLVNLNGSPVTVSGGSYLQKVSPKSSTVYTAVATNGSSSVACSASLSVQEIPGCKIDLAPDSLRIETSATTALAGFKADVTGIFSTESSYTPSADTGYIDIPFTFTDYRVLIDGAGVTVIGGDPLSVSITVKPLDARGNAGIPCTAKLP